MTELEKFDHKICETQKKYDELQSEARAKEAKLRGLSDQLADLKREAETVKSNMKDSPQAKVCHNTDLSTIFCLKTLTY